MQIKPWRIGIDCRLAGKQHAGIGRYIENLIIRLPELAQHDQQKIEWIFFFHDQAQADEFHLPSQVTTIIIPYRHYSLLEQLAAHRYFTAQKLDLLHIPHFNVPLLYQGKIVITIHDLLWHEYKGSHVTTLPRWKYLIKYRAYLFTVGQAVRRASWIFVPAETVKKTLFKYYSFSKVKTEITLEGIANQYRQAITTTLNPAKSKRTKQLIYVGSLYPHKNVQVILHALAELPDFRLILVGSRNIFHAQTQKLISKLGLENRVEMKGYLTDQELITHYQESFALIQPSLSEGFGLTGVEAMAAGIPVIASKIPIFQEIYQDAALYFDPLSSHSFVTTIQELELASWPKILEKGKKVAGQYNWDRTANKTFAGYLRTLT